MKSKVAHPSPDALPPRELTFPDHDDSMTLRVKSGQSIQEVINYAKPGSRIVVEAGTYAEQLLIQKDGISLVGKGAMLTMPTYPVSNPCSGLAGDNSQAGICIMGGGVDMDEFKAEHRKVLSVRYPVQGVSVTGFTISNFFGAGIAVYGGKDTKIMSNKINNFDFSYGVLSVGSVNSFISKNNIPTVPAGGSLGFIGICVDDFSGAKVESNTISESIIGICTSTSGAKVNDNTVSQTCIGAFIDPNVNGARVHDNTFSGSLAKCAAVPAGAFGVIIGGASDNVVRKNLIQDMHSAVATAGVAVFDEPCTGSRLSLQCIYLGHGVVANNNVVKNNIFVHNDLDLWKATNGTGNVFIKNDCMTSTPPGLCAMK